jgi:hypothetical protein
MCPRKDGSCLDPVSQALITPHGQRLNVVDLVFMLDRDAFGLRERLHHHRRSRAARRHDEERRGAHFFTAMTAASRPNPAAASAR